MRICANLSLYSSVNCARRDSREIFEFVSVTLEFRGKIHFAFSVFSRISRVLAVSGEKLFQLRNVSVFFLFLLCVLC